MMKDGEFIINDPVTIKITMHYCHWGNWTSNPTSSKKFTIEFDGINNIDEIEEVFPSIQTLEYYPIFGKIVLYNNDTITAILYKNSINSEIKTIEEQD